MSKQSFSLTWKLSLIQKLSNQFCKLLTGFSRYSYELFHWTQQDYLQTTPLPWYRKVLNYPSPSVGNFLVLEIFASSSEYLPEWDKQHLLISPYTQISAYIVSCSVGWSTKAKLRGFVKEQPNVLTLFGFSNGERTDKATQLSGWETHDISRVL